MDSGYLAATALIDVDHPAVAEYAGDATLGAEDDRAKAVQLYERVRDDFRYDPYRVSLEPADMTASAVIERGNGFCIPKATLLAATGRAVGIPTRLGFADVRNHLATQKLLDRLGTDLFIWHGYMEFHLDGRWVKATPAFNLSLCEKFGVKPLEFDGATDSIFHPYDEEGRRHMEYVADRGTYADVPLDQIVRDFADLYPHWASGSDGDFGAEALSEREAGPQERSR